MIRFNDTSLPNRFSFYNLHVALTTALLLTLLASQAQNVGVGTTNPSRRLSVNGAVLIDQNNTATGTLDSAALLFGSTGTVGILSKKTPGGNTNGLSFITGGDENLVISVNGNIGLGGPYSTLHRLRVNDGNSYFEGDITASLDINSLGRMAVGGNIDTAYKLRVYGGNGRIGGDFHATGNVGVGGAVDHNFRLRVHDGSSYFDGPVHISGPLSTTSIGASGVVSANNVNADNMTTENLTVTQELTIGGKGSVRSNGPSSLRIGFDSKSVDIVIPANGGVTVTADITDFTGDNDDVRVFVSQIVTGGGNTLFLDKLTINITNIDAAANTCQLRLANHSNSNATLVGTIYLTTIAKN